MASLHSHGAILFFIRWTYEKCCGVLEEIRKATYYARSKTQEFAQFINKKSSSENRRELTAKVNELSKLEQRNADLNDLFKRLYEDNFHGKITNEQFRMLDTTRSSVRSRNRYRNSKQR